jgi:hypothetical protein
MSFKIIIFSFLFSWCFINAESNFIIINEDSTSYSVQNGNVTQEQNSSYISESNNNIIMEEEMNNSIVDNSQLLSSSNIHNSDPHKITLLYIDSPHCPYCRKLDKLLLRPESLKLLKKYFIIDRKNLDGDLELPKGLPLPYGTPTVYFLNSKDMALVEPMRGEKTEKELLYFLNEAIDENKRMNKEKEEKSKNLWEKALEE